MSANEPETVPESKPRWRRWLIEGLIVLSFFIGFQVWQARNTPRGLAPQIAGQLVDGEAFNLEKWRQKNAGKAVMLYFWAEWCAICKTTAGNVSSISRDWPVITIATDSGGAEQIAKLMADKNYRWATLPDPRGQVLRQYGLPGTPAFIIINPAGEVRFVSLGFTSEIGLRLRLWWASQEKT